MHTDWPLVIGVLSFLFGVICAVGTAMFQAGGQRVRLENVEKEVAALKAQAELHQQQLAKGDTRFATLAQAVDAMKETLAEIKALLTAPRRRRPARDGAPPG